MPDSLDHLVLTLVSTAPAVATMRVGLLGRRVPVRGLSVREIVEVAARHPDERDTVWRIFGLSQVDAGPMTARGAAALFELLQTSLGSRSKATLFRLVRLPAARFDRIVSTMVQATVPAPDDVDALFKAREAKAEHREEEQVVYEDGAWRDPAVVLARIALDLEKHFPDPLSWTPGRLLFVSSVVAERGADVARRALLDAAVAARLGQADAKSWKRAIGEISGGSA